jgi:hypothetical protein
MLFINVSAIIPVLTRQIVTTALHILFEISTFYSCGSRRVSDSSYSASYRKLTPSQTSLTCKLSSREYDPAVMWLVGIKAVYVEYYASTVGTHNIYEMCIECTWQ